MLTKPIIWRHVESLLTSAEPVVGAEGRIETVSEGIYRWSSCGTPSSSLVGMEPRPIWIHLDCSPVLQSHYSSSTAPPFEQCILGSRQLSYSLWAELVSVCWVPYGVWCGRATGGPLAVLFMTSSDPSCSPLSHGPPPSSSSTWQLPRILKSGFTFALAALRNWLLVYTWLSPGLGQTS